MITNVSLLLQGCPKRICDFFPDLQCGVGLHHNPFLNNSKQTNSKQTTNNNKPERKRELNQNLT